VLVVLIAFESTQGCNPAPNVEYYVSRVNQQERVVKIVDMVDAVKYESRQDGVKTEGDEKNDQKVLPAPCLSAMAQAVNWPKEQTIAEDREGEKPCQRSAHDSRH
jgi:hypothetical protein